MVCFDVTPVPLQLVGVAEVTRRKISCILGLTEPASENAVGQGYRRPGPHTKAALVARVVTGTRLRTRNLNMTMLTRS